MSVTIATLANKLATRFRDPNKEVISCDQWYEYINTTWQDIQQTTSQWPWNKTDADITVTVAANQRFGCLSESYEVLEVRSVIDTTNNQPLSQNSGNGAFQALQGESPTAVADRPNRYRVEGREIEVYPTPSSAVTLTVRAKKWPQATFAYNECPPIPSAFEYVLIDGALSLAHLDDEAFDAYQVHAGRFNNGLKNMLGAFLNGQEEKYPLMPVQSV